MSAARTVNRAAEFLVGLRRPTVEPQFWWVRYNSISPCAQMAADGASCSLMRVPAKVGLPKRERLLSVVGGNASSCPKGDLGPRPENLSGRRVSGHSIEQRVCCLTTEPLLKQVGDIELSSHDQELTLMTPPLRLSCRRCAAVER